MKKETFDLGMVGLGTMGRNFALNISDNGYSVFGLDKSEDKVEAYKQTGTDAINATTDPKEFIANLKKPRAVMLLVPAGKAVDSVIDELLPMLDEDDLIIDGGNSHFTETNPRYDNLTGQGIHFMGVGISGGEKGARFGPSIMPGGSKDAYPRIKPIFESAAARVNDEPCVTWLGPRSAGHYVKMVHNGIEYGLMQLISESYNIMKQGLGFDNEKLHQVYSDWNEGKLSSFLIGITADIFARHDDKSDGWLIDKISDSAKQKGTGKWASQDAMNLQEPTPNIDMAVAMRHISAFKPNRLKAAKVIKGPEHTFEGDPDQFMENLQGAMYFGMIITFAQGMGLLKAASRSYDYGLNLADIAKIWRGGCIIRADLLEDIRRAFSDQADLPNLLLDAQLSKVLQQNQSHLRNVSAQAAKHGIPAPVLKTSLSYFDAYRSKWLPANLIQAQRDDFGSHTYERLDAEGTFHTSWNENEEEE